ncbi:CoxG family protein [Thermoflexus sp.]|uniref:CoxG family protein n=1 Tax=Thermoflexus sp. TaxID=1969742 RepID=UPI0035E42E17
MVIREAFTVRAPVERVWAFLEDVPRLATYVPGVEAVEETGPDRYRGRLAVRIGPISARFEGVVRIIQREPPARLEAEMEGQDGASASWVKAAFLGTLEPAAEGTRLACEIDLTLRGRLAQFGSAVLEATARRMIHAFAQRLQEALESPHAP